MINPCQTCDLNKGDECSVNYCPKIALAYDIIKEIVDEDNSCRLDHHGNCQEHMGNDVDGVCLNKKMVNFLKHFA